MFVTGVVLVLIWGLIAAAAALPATHDPYAIDFGALLKPPGEAHWFGTDNVGRDTYSRVVYGGILYTSPSPTRPS